MSGEAARHCLEQLLSVDDVLGIVDRDSLPVALSLLPEDVQQMVADRQKARAARDFEASDHLRDQLASAGYQVKDSASGPQVYRV
jgi:cysteinyl-tRNA synthetase